MLHYKEFSAFVTVDGVELEQYRSEVFPEEAKVICWIASEVGKSFVVRWEDSVRSCPTSGRLKIDGESMGGKRTKSFGSQIDGVSSGSSLRPFVFSRLQTTDDDAYLELAPENIGEIVLKIWRIELHGKEKSEAKSTLPVKERKKNSRKKNPKITPRGEEAMTGTIQRVHEQSKKAGMHCVVLGEEVERLPRPSTGPLQRSSDLDSTPVATFVFKYRDRDLLKANGIIPTQIPRKRKAVVESDEEEDNTDRIIQAIGDAMGALQQLVALQGKKKIKKGNSVKKKIKNDPQRPKFVPSGEVIDLT
ncbi:hypothetical protein BV22DRAFT_1132729 [Leucogyrophana mollusca]|uniref:Uncharacterized protein n=1 Tax=Leucogyrophana mollusca TaxID=85980 RepID=A0ACB8B5S2_9AGAM|nr:hypothetical protein BV22DRAFT_1132729 [Leucogyrophana mollusca]